MNKLIPTIVFVSAGALSAPLAFAQAATGAANAAAHAAAQARVPATLPPARPVTPPAPAMPPPATVSAGAGASVQGAGMGARPVVTPPASSQAAAHASSKSAIAGATKTGSQGAAHASTTGLAHGAAFNGGASATLEPDVTVKEIKAASFASRKDVAAEVDTKLEVSDKAVDDLETRAANADEKSRANLAKALVEVRAREKALRASLRESTKADGEVTWGSVQSELAKNYGDYAKAVADAEATVTTDTVAK